MAPDHPVRLSPEIAVGASDRRHQINRWLGVGSSGGASNLPVLKKSSAVADVIALTLCSGALRIIRS